MGEGFLFLTLPDHCPTLREASQELKAGAQETGAEAEATEGSQIPVS